MRTTVMAVGLGLVTVFAGACQGSGDDAAALAGSWQSFDSDTGDLTGELSFTGDGHFTMVEHHDSGDDSTQGTYAVDGTVMTLDGTDDQGRAVAADFDYYVSDTDFMLGALLPDGQVDGVVGTWSGHMHVSTDGDEAIDETDTYRLEDDGTATVHAVTPDRTVDTTGTWQMEGAGGVVVSFMQDNISINVHMALLDGAALGGQIYTRAGGT